MLSRPHKHERATDVENKFYSGLFPCNRHISIPFPISQLLHCFHLKILYTIIKQVNASLIAQLAADAKALLPLHQLPFIAHSASRLRLSTYAEHIQKIKCTSSSKFCAHQSSYFNASFAKKGMMGLPCPSFCILAHFSYRTDLK